MYKPTNGLRPLAAMFSCALSAGGFAAQSHAQEGRALQALDEIVVTARKREESLQDIPISVTAFSGELLRDLQIRNTADIAEFTPGFSFHSYLGREEDRPVVRGMSNILGQANASFFIDGVFVPGSIAATELRNLERVEVIKGPQAALYGRATFAGAINFVTRNPGNDYEGEISLTGAEHDEYELVASHMGPLVQDRLFYYVAGRYFQYGGEYRNELTGRLVGDQETRGLTGKLLWTPNETFDATLRVTYAEDRDGHPALWLQGQEFNNCFLRDPATAPAARGYYCGEALFNDTVRLRTDILPNGGGLRRDVLRSALTMNWDIAGGHTLTSVTGWQDEELARELDVSYAGYDPLVYLFALLVVPDNRGSFWRVQAEERSSFSQELRLSSPSDRAFRWLAGGYYFKDDADLIQNDKMNPLTIFPSAVDPSTAVLQRNSFTEFRTTENIAAFASVELDFNEQWTATAEARWAVDRLSYNAFNTAGAPAASLAEKFYSVTPRVTLTYRHSEDLTVYGNVARGTKPGGFNDPGAVERLSYDEEESTNYEVGFKSTLWNGQARWNVAAFYIDWKDQQLTFTAQRPDGTLFSFIENVGKTRVMGLETEVSVLLADNWTLDLSYSYVDSEIRNYVSQDQADLLGCVPATTEPARTVYFQCIQERGSVAGNQTPRSPKHQAALRTRYFVPLAGGNEWYIGGNVTMESSRFSQVHNLIETGDRWLVGLQTGLRGERWDVSLWVKNLFNDKTVVDILRYIDTEEWTNAAPAACPPNFPFRPGLNCGPYFLQQAWGASTPRGFANTLPRQRQVGVTASLRF